MFFTIGLYQAAAAAATGLFQAAVVDFELAMVMLAPAAADGV